MSVDRAYYSGTKWGKMVFGIVDSGVIEHEDLNQ
jgi:hypothetical protein